MPSISLHGAVYGDNFGDVLIHSILSKELARRGLSTWWPLSAPKFREQQRRLGWTPRGKALPNLNGIVFGPGGYLSVGSSPNSVAEQSRWNRRFYSYHLPALLASHGLRKSAFFGLEIGPVPSRFSDAVIRAAVEKSQLVAVRTAESARWLVDTWGITPLIIPDVALSLDHRDSSLVRVRDGGALLHVGEPRLWRSDDRMQQVFRELSKDYSTKIITDTSRLTRATHKVLGDSKLRLHVIPYSGVFGLLRAISTSQIVVTTKLHVSICAYALGIPVVQIHQHSKTRHFNDATASQGQALQQLEEFSPRGLPDLMAAALRSSRSLMWVENRREERRKLSEAFDALAASVGSREAEC